MQGRLYRPSRVRVDVGQLLGVVEHAVVRVVVADCDVLGLSPSPEGLGDHVGDAIGHALPQREGLARDRVDWDVLAVSIPGSPPDGDQDVGREEEEDQGDDGRDDEGLRRRGGLVVLGLEDGLPHGGVGRTLRVADLPMMGDCGGDVGRGWP